MVLLNYKFHPEDEARGLHSRDGESQDDPGGQEGVELWGKSGAKRGGELKR